MTEHKGVKLQCIRATGRVEVLAWWPSLPADFRQCHHIVIAVITPASQVAVPTHFPVTPSFFFLRYSRDRTLGCSFSGWCRFGNYLSGNWIVMNTHVKLLSVDLFFSIAVYIHGIIHSNLHWALCELHSNVFELSQASAIPLYGLSLSAVPEHKP